MLRGRVLLLRQRTQVAMERQLARAGNSDTWRPGGTAWMILCPWQQFVMAEIQGDKPSGSKKSICLLVRAAQCIHTSALP